MKKSSNHIGIGISFRLKPIKGYICEYNGRNYNDLGFLRNRLRKGDFSSTVPFGLISVEKSEFKLLFRNKDFPSSIIIGDVIIGKKNSSFELVNFDYNPIDDVFIQAIMDLVLSDVGMKLVELGFTRPQDVRTFMNRFSKDIFSKRDKYKEIIEIQGLDIQGIKSERKFTLHEAYSLNIWKIGREKKLFISLFPRHEIMELGLNFPIQHAIKEKIMEKWEQKIKWTGNSIKTVSIPILKEIGKHLARIGYCDVFSINPQLEPIEGNLPEPLYKLSYSNIICERKKHLPTKTFFKKLFFQSINSLPTLDVDLIVDQEISFNEIHPFLENLQNSVPLVIKNDMYLAKEKNIVSQRPKLIVLNNFLTGYKGYYSQLKSELINTPHKVILKKTVLDYINNRNDEIFVHIYLSLLHRQTGTLFWKLKNEWYDEVVGIYVTSRHSGSLQLVATTINNNNGLETLIRIGYRSLLYSITKEINEILEHLLDARVNSKKLLLIFYQRSSTFIKEIADNLIPKYYEKKCIHIVNISDNENIRIMKNQSETDYNPQRGSYFALDYMHPYHNFLLITTGYPDIQENGEHGFTRPILLQIFDPESSLNNELMKIILKTIYFHSQIHPTSLSQTSLPLELHNGKKAIDISLINRNSELRVSGGIL